MDFVPLLTLVLLIKEGFSLLILSSCVPVSLFSKGRDENCRWKENVPGKRSDGKNLLLNHIKLRFLFTFLICQVSVVSASFCKPCLNLSKEKKNVEAKCCVINQGDKCHLINCHNGVSESVSLSIPAETV